MLRYKTFPWRIGAADDRLHRRRSQRQSRSWRLGRNRRDPGSTRHGTWGRLAAHDEQPDGVEWRDRGAAARLDAGWAGCDLYGLHLSDSGHHTVGLGLAEARMEDGAGR